MDITMIQLSPSLYPWLIGLGLMIFSWLRSSVLIYLAIIACMIGVIFANETEPGWVEVGAGLIAFWCGTTIARGRAGR